MKKSLNIFYLFRLFLGWKGKRYNKRMNCPICHEPLVRGEKSYHCPNRHTFDIAKSGYVNLSRKQKAGGDNKLMVQARSEFLESGYYAFLRTKLTEILEEIKPHNYLDLGCGQGYYTRELSQSATHAYGIDLSVPAITHASKHDKKTQYIVGSIYDLPFEDASMDLLTSIFTPIPSAEAARVLKENGLLITVTPGEMHHIELKEQLYENVRLNPPLKPVEGFELENQIEISQVHHVEDVMALLKMTPYFYRTPKEAIEKLEHNQQGLAITFNFVISTWRKHNESQN